MLQTGPSASDIKGEKLTKITTIQNSFDSKVGQEDLLNWVQKQYVILCILKQDLCFEKIDVTYCRRFAMA